MSLYPDEDYIASLLISDNGLNDDLMAIYMDRISHYLIRIEDLHEEINRKIKSLLLRVRESLGNLNELLDVVNETESIRDLIDSGDITPEVYIHRVSTNIQRVSTGVNPMFDLWDKEIDVISAIDPIISTYYREILGKMSGDEEKLALLAMRDKERAGELIDKEQKFVESCDVLIKKVFATGFDYLSQIENEGFRW